MRKSVEKKKQQLERFKKTAHEVGADTSDDALDKVMGKLDLKKKPYEKGEKSAKG